MVERKCKSCGLVFGQSLDDGASSDDTEIGLCEICQGELPGVDSGKGKRIRQAVFRTRVNAI